ncbi:hypothetical protein QO004_004813 [Rhizobium mesoamericanum]|nr:hypothetical protein [Rhizobium mesoamericanum]
MFVQQVGKPLKFVKDDQIRTQRVHTDPRQDTAQFPNHGSRPLIGRIGWICFAPRQLRGGTNALNEFVSDSSAEIFRDFLRDLFPPHPRNYIWPIFCFDTSSEDPLHSAVSNADPLP